MTASPLKNSTVVFDLDGTLVDTAPDLVNATNHVLASLSLPPRPSESLRPWISHGARRMIVEALAQSGRTSSETETDRLLDMFLIHYEANIARDSRPYPHVVAEIETLRNSGARVAICTNKREALTLKLLDALELSSLFAAIVGRDTLPVSKPDPRHLIETIARAGGQPAHAVMVGDSRVDVSTARAAGIPIIGVTFGYSDRPISSFNPDVTLDDYVALSSHVAALLARR